MTYSKNKYDRSSRSSRRLLANTAAIVLAGLLGYVGGRLPSSENAEPASPAARPSTSFDNAFSQNEPASWDDRWQSASQHPVSPAATRDREAILEDLARTDPQRALQLALAEKNWLVRDRLRAAALRGWGAVAPDAAVEWALAQSTAGDRMQCVEAALTGAAEQPAEATRVGLQVCSSDPIAAGAYGHTLINALVERTGDFEAATQFAIAARMVDRQAFLLDSAFYQWAQHDPVRARQEFSRIEDPAVRSAALKGVIEGWADSDPRQLADFAQALPSGDDRTQALAVALPKWAQKDPESLLQWVGGLDPDPAFDRGFAAIAQQPALLAQQPEIAMDIVENIVDPVHRTLARQNTFYQWALENPAAARAYAQKHPNPELRESFLDDVAIAENARLKP